MIVKTDGGEFRVPSWMTNFEALKSMLDDAAGGVNDWTST